jgi:sugar lactone lactonase YvrE
MQINEVIIMKAELLYPSQCFLGESPLWHAERKCCFWVDIENGVLYEYNWISQTARSWKFNHRLTLVVQGKGNQLILALDATIPGLTWNQSSSNGWFLLRAHLLTIGCNDGACDNSGRLWLGTMHLEHKNEAGALYCVDTNSNVHKKVNNISISNGIVWSLDNKRLYYIDSPTQVVQSFIFEEGSGEIIFEKNIIRYLLKWEHQMEWP